MTKKICFFSAQYLPHMGGVERYTFNICKNLLERGYMPTVVTSNLNHLPSVDKMDGIPIYRFNCFAFLEGRYPFLKKDKIYKDIMESLKKENFDLVVVNTRFYRHSLEGMKFAKDNNIPCITIEHGTSHLSVNNKFFDFCGSIYEHLLTNIGKKYCNHYYGVSKSCTEWLKHFHIKADGVLYNSIDVDEVKSLRNNKIVSYRKRYNLPNNAIVISFTGRLIPEKGIVQLLNVMEKINKKYNNVYLFIAGEGILEGEILNRNDKNIKLLGRLDFQHVISLLDETDIFCLPSFSEGFSTSILEAAACDCFIVTTARGGAKELLISDEYGTVIENNSESLLFPALEEAILNKEKREFGSRLSYEKLKNNFTWSKLVDQLEEILNSDK